MKKILFLILISSFSFATQSRLYVNSTGQVPFRFNAALNTPHSPVHTGIIAPVVVVNTDLTNLNINSNMQLTTIAKNDTSLPNFTRPRNFSSFGTMSLNSSLILGYFDSSNVYQEITVINTMIQSITKAASSPLIFSFKETDWSMVYLGRSNDFGLMPYQNYSPDPNSFFSVPWYNNTYEYSYFQLNGYIAFSCANCTGNKFTASGTVLVQSLRLDYQGRLFINSSARNDSDMTEMLLNYPVNFNIY